ncbi:MAG: hypothetical protein DRI69_01910 [Bacteroidetes bacterium]|nr:MAG: hypothetical protein DRI69_01910 [Bacteroidota bacterium]
MSVRRHVYVKQWWTLPGVEARALEAAIALGVDRAKVYAPVDTGRLKASIRRENKDTFGSSVRYAYYQETGHTYTSFTPFLEPALKDVAEAMPGIYRRAILGMR